MRTYIGKHSCQRREQNIWGELGEEVVREVASPSTYGMQSNDGKYWSYNKSMTRLLIFFFNAISFQGTGVVTVHEVLIFCSFMCVCESSHRLKAHDKFC